MRARILIVDDDPDIVLALENRVTWMGHEPVTASDGKAALRIIQTEQPDLVLLDIQLPVFSGLEILQQIHAKATGKQSWTLSLAKTPKDLTTDQALRATSPIN